MLNVARVMSIGRPNGEKMFIEDQIKRHYEQYGDVKQGYVMKEFVAICQKYVISNQIERRRAIFLHVMLHELRGRSCRMTKKLRRNKSWHVSQSVSVLPTYRFRELLQ